MVPPLVVAVVVAGAPPVPPFAAGGAAVAVGLEEGKTLSDIAKKKKVFEGFWKRKGGVKGEICKERKSEFEEWN